MLSPPTLQVVRSILGRRENDHLMKFSSQSVFVCANLNSAAFVSFHTHENYVCRCSKKNSSEMRPIRR